LTSAKGNLGASIVRSLRPATSFIAEEQSLAVAIEYAEYTFELVPRLSARLAPADLTVGTAPAVFSQRTAGVLEFAQVNGNQDPGNRARSEASPVPTPSEFISSFP
jgi:hypothetical protein